MSNFTFLQLQDIAISQTGPFGSQLHESDYVLVGTPIVTVEHLGEFRFSTQNLPLVSDEDLERLKKYKLEIGDIVFSRVGSIDRCSFVTTDEEGWLFSGRCIRVRCNDLVDSRYLYYYFRQNFFRKMMLDVSVGATMPSLNTRIMNELSIQILSIAQQKQIAKVLSDLDAKIEVNNKINQQLETMAKTLYDYWFVQFDFPDENGKPYKSSGGKMVYNEELKREIPDGWEVSVILDLVNITTGRLDSNAEVKDGKFHFYTCAASPTKTDSFAFEGEVILIAGNNASGNFHVNRYSGKFNAYQRTYVITAKSKEYLDYCYQVIGNQMKVLKTRGNGSQTKFLTIGMLNDIEVFNANNNLLRRYFEIVNPFYKKQVNLYEENQKLTELRDWLLPMLMNGQVSVGSPDVNRDQVNSKVNSNSNSNDAGVVDGGLGRVAEGGGKTGKKNN